MQDDVMQLIRLLKAGVEGSLEAKCLSSSPGLFYFCLAVKHMPHVLYGPSLRPLRSRTRISGDSLLVGSVAGALVGHGLTADRPHFWQTESIAPRLG